MSGPLQSIKNLVCESRGKPVAVLGAGKTGLSLARLLSKQGFLVELWDENPALRDSLDYPLCTPGEQIKAYVFFIASPGIAPNSKLFSSMLNSGITEINEIDFAVSFIGQPLVAVTGTNGKTSTTELMGQLLRAASRPVEVLGNVGMPFADKIELLSDEPRALDYVAELSSYQLERASCLAPRIGIWLNLTEDHLERHGSMERYAEAKGNLFRNQGSEDWALLNAGDAAAEQLRAMASGSVAYFGEHCPEGFSSCRYEKKEKRFFLQTPNFKESISAANCPLSGAHNFQNLASVLLAGSLLGIERSAMESFLETALLPPHRLEPVAERAGVRYINDSKATNVSAVITALEALREDARVLLLLGGKKKSGSWASLADYIAQSGTRVICFGADADAIKLEMKSPVECVVATLDEALQEAAKRTKDGDVVLLSPGCASFDAYSGFEERGEHFRSLVAGLG